MEKYFEIENRIDYEMKGFSGHYAIYANDFKGNVISINSDEPWETASCIKVSILLTLFKEVEKGKLILKEKIIFNETDFVVGSGILRSLSFGVEMTLLDIATLMIIVSDNVATNMLIRLLGVDVINETMKDLGLEHTRLHHKIDFETYDDLGTFTAYEYGKMFEYILSGPFSKENNSIILDILSKQHYNSSLTRELPHWLLDSENTGEEELIKILSKSGSMDNCRNDGGIVSTPFGRYVVIILTKDFKDKMYYSDHESYRFAPKVTSLLYNHFISKKGSF